MSNPHDRQNPAPPSAKPDILTAGTANLSAYRNAKCSANHSANLSANPNEHQKAGEMVVVEMSKNAETRNPLRGQGKPLVGEQPGLSRSWYHSWNRSWSYSWKSASGRFFALSDSPAGQ